MMPYIRVGTLLVPTYFIVISISLSILMFLLSYRVDKFKKDRKTAFDLSLVLMVAGFIGGRLLHVFYEEWPYYRDNPIQVLYFWNGGFVFFGGLLLCLLAGFVFLRVKKQSFFEWGDFMAPLFSLGHSLGRIGCVLAGCCYGGFCDLPWAYQGRHPTALYLVIGEFFIFLYLLFAEKKKIYKRQGSLFMKWMLLHCLLRFNVEYVRDDFRGVFVRFPLLGLLSISQMICLALIVACLLFFAWPYLEDKKSATR